MPLHFPGFTMYCILVTYVVTSEKLLLLGDSLDRFISSEWCQDIQGKTGTKSQHTHWGLEYLKYTSNAHASDYCFSPFSGDSVAYAHIFGSKATGPYYKDLISTPEDPYVDSAKRVPKAVSLYVEQFGYPDRVILNTEKWDIQYYNQHHKDKLQPGSLFWNEAVALFNSSIHDRLRDIKSLLPDYVDIGLRTSVWETTCGDMLRVFNNVIRSIALDNDLSLYDQDSDLWAAVQWNVSKTWYLFRDWIHPRAIYSLPVAQKMLGRQYSKYMRFPSASSSMYDSRFKSALVGMFQQGFSSNSSANIYLLSPITKNNDSLMGQEKLVYYYTEKIGLAYRNASNEFQIVLRFSKADIYDFFENALSSKIPMSPELIPTDLFVEGVVFNDTQRKMYYMLVDGLKRELPNEPTAIHLQQNFNRRVVHIGASESDITRIFFDQIHTSIDLPNIFLEDSVIRCSCSNEIFYVKNLSRHSIPNMNVFMSLGKDLSEVVVAQQIDFELLPLGLPL